MQRIVFLGHTLDAIRDFPRIARREAGYQLDRVQHGLNPVHWKPMTSVGNGVMEIRISDEGQFRIIYITRIREAVYVLHAFRKKSRKTTSKDLETARRAYKLVIENQ